MEKLMGMRVAILTTNGVEESELTEPLEALRQNGAEVDILSPDGGEVQMMRHDDKTRKIASTGRIADANPDDYTAVMLPGGVVNADELRMNEDARTFVRRMQDSGRTIAAICHAPWLLVSAGLVRGKHLTSFHTLQDDIRNAGGTWTDEELVRDGNWITSRSPRDLPAFNQALVDATSRVQRAA